MILRQRLQPITHYRAIRDARGDVKEKVISLTFADDEYFPALQAADMVAWLTRREAQREFYGNTYEFRELYSYLISGGHKMRWLKLFLPRSEQDKNKTNVEY